MMKVTLLSGFLGAGKTTLLKRILRLNNDITDSDKLKMAVIVNDMGEINLDADEIRNSKVVQEDAEMVEMHNGCICCTLRGDLLKTVKSLSEEGKYDYLVIESTGIGEPLPVAQTFTMDVDGDDDDDHRKEGEEPEPKKKKQEPSSDTAEDKKSLSHYATLDTLVTVVDALNIYDVLGSIETLADKNNVSGMVGNTGASDTNNEEEEKKDAEGDVHLEEDEGGEDIDDRQVSQLWLDQIEFANIIVVSKASIFLKKESEAKLKEIEILLQKLNPNAKIIIPRKDKYGDLDVSKTLINTGLFNMEEAAASDSWLEELKKEEHNPETEEYGISSMTFTCDQMPFHPERLSDILTGFGDYSSAIDSNNSTSSGTDSNDNIFQGVFRTKGKIWLANANAFPLDFQTAGKHIDMGVNDETTAFLAAMNKTEWEDEEHNTYKELVNAGLWTKKYGDRRSQLVFIGVGLNKDLIQKKLTAALLTEEENISLGGMKGWRSLSDPFFGHSVYDHFELPEPYGAPYE